MRLGKVLAKSAKKMGICREWHDELKGLTDKEAMVRMYLKGIDFCLANEFPSNDFIRDNFKGMMEGHGIFLDESFGASDIPKCVCLGTARGELSMSGWSVGEVFLKHECELNLDAGDNSFVVVDIFDNAKLNVHAHGRAKVRVNRYGGIVGVTGDDAADNEAVVSIREKNKKTY